jgi:hypothetical protein
MLFLKKASEKVKECFYNLIELLEMEAITLQILSWEQNFLNDFFEEEIKIMEVMESR